MSSKRDPLHLHIEKSLERVWLRKANKIELVGVDSPAQIALLLSQSLNKKFWEQPNLLVFSTDDEARKFESDCIFFDPTLVVQRLSGFDVSPYSGLYPNSRAIADRLGWLALAGRTPPRTLLIASIEGLLQRTIPVQVFSQNSMMLRTGSDLPSSFTSKLEKMGYQASPVVEDRGTFAMRGGLIDLYSPAHKFPARVELFGDSIESIRLFNPETQRSEEVVQSFQIIPARETLFTDDTRMRATKRFNESRSGRTLVAEDVQDVLHGLTNGIHVPGLDFLIGDFYTDFHTPMDHFSEPPNVWLINPIDIAREVDLLFQTRKTEFLEAEEHVLRPKVADLYLPFEGVNDFPMNKLIEVTKIVIDDQPFSDESGRDGARASDSQVPWSCQNLKFAQSSSTQTLDLQSDVFIRLRAIRDARTAVFIATNTTTQAQRLLPFLERAGFFPVVCESDQFNWHQWWSDQDGNADRIHLVPHGLSESFHLPQEQIAFLRDEDFFGKKQRRRENKSTGTIAQRTHTLSFGDLNPGDRIVHTQHGIGIYEGLKVMPINGINAEFIQVAYKDGDKLYLPVYRVGQIQKYSGPSGSELIDKLGHGQWQKTKIKVRNQLRELALDLVQLYAKRAQTTRPPFPINDTDFEKFEAAFPYDETDDQLKAVDQIVKDMTSDKPMDRLVCGDVGFGKTEVAMRAAFKAVEGGKQVAVLAPTTVLTFQHLETFQKRFRAWPLTIRALNRFVPPAEAKKTLAELKEGKVDIVIGTHRILSKDIAFKDLGLLIVDEEQKFGVVHKEKIKKMKSSVDTLAMSATPIPRTLNMSLVGIRDLSIINTAPVDRLPTRTFVCKFDEETIRKAITAEIARGGQVFFLHNRVQSIYGVLDDLRKIVPDARIRVGHGQMEEHELEATMVAFFNHEIDILLCTTIIESGIDNPRANTMFIDNSHTFGLSQLYQLRGRVGRSKERAYCYLLVPPNRRLEKDAQERLKIIQENTALGSGFRIANHDMELRGAGNLLGEDQSGSIDSVGYEMYLELLDEAIKTVRGEEIIEEVEPDINVRIPALIPDDYIPDLRIRLSYYKAMSDIDAPEDLDRIEDELRDQFGKLPEQVVNLMGLMLIRFICRKLGIRDLSAGPKTISLAFTDKTPLPPQKVVSLAMLETKKFSLTPDNRLIIRMNNITWPNIYEELQYLSRLCAAPVVTKRQ